MELLRRRVDKMSLERASVNCRRCYHLAKIIIEDSCLDEAINNNLNYDNGLWDARNNAMMALEDSSSGYLDAYVRETNKIEKTYSTQCIDALRACERCDYSAPKIADLVELRRKESE
jgi:hypothetical protein